MGDHFVFLVDRLLTESTLEAAIESRNQKQVTVEDMAIDCSSKKDSEAATSLKQIVECRICQDEDFDSNMETPCNCCGSLKYAHRKCVQRWCNEKGDTLCEICNQPFTPGYTAPPPIFRLGGIPMNFRGNWGIARRDLNYAHLTAAVSADRNFVDSSHDDYVVSTSSSNVMCFRSIAIIVISLSLMYSSSIWGYILLERCNFSLFKSSHLLLYAVHGSSNSPPHSSNHQCSSRGLFIPLNHVATPKNCRGGFSYLRYIQSRDFFPTPQTATG